MKCKVASRGRYLLMGSTIHAPCLIGHTTLSTYPPKALGGNPTGDALASRRAHHRASPRARSLIRNARPPKRAAWAGMPARHVSTPGGHRAAGGGGDEEVGPTSRLTLQPQPFEPRFNPSLRSVRTCVVNSKFFVEWPRSARGQLSAPPRGERAGDRLGELVLVHT